MAITSNQRILTLDYWKYASQLKAGDYVFDRQGNPVKIKLIQQYYAQDCYEVMFDDYLTVQGDRHLALPLETPKYRNRLATYKGYHKFRRPLKHTKLAALENNSLRDKRNRKMFSVPTTQPINFPTQPNLPIPPFVFGYWIINRGVNKTLTVKYEHKDFIYEQFKDHGYIPKRLRDIHGSTERFSVIPQIEKQLAPFIPHAIPENYLMGSVEQRTELLRGILYARPRQYEVKSDTFKITLSDAKLAGQIRFLVESLGHRTRPYAEKNDKSITLYFKSRTPLVNYQTSPPLKIHHGRRYVTEIIPIQPQMCVHIETEGDDTILVNEGFISTC